MSENIPAKAETPEITRTLKCTSCGAPIKYVEGENLISCSYCGTTNMLAGFDRIVKVENHRIIPNEYTKSQIEQICREWMTKGFFKASDLDEQAVFDTTEGFFLPFWVTTIEARTFWAGLNKRVRWVGSGRSRRMDKHYVPVNGEFTQTLNWAIYARQDTERYFGLEALNPGSHSVEADWGGFVLNFGLGEQTSTQTDFRKGSQPFTLELAKSLPILNGQVIRENAETHSRNRVIEYHRSLAQRKCARVTDVDTTTYVKETQLIYVPLWFITYRYKDKRYQMLVNGYSGEVEKGQAPVGKYDKAVVLSVVMAILAILFTVLATKLDPQFFYGTGASVAIAVLYWLYSAAKKD